MLVPKVKSLKAMCAEADTTLENLYENVRTIIPKVDPLVFEIWCCKFVNFLHVLHMHKQPSLAWRRTLAEPAEALMMYQALHCDVCVKAWCRICNDDTEKFEEANITRNKGLGVDTRDGDPWRIYARCQRQTGKST